MKNKLFCNNLKTLIIVTFVILYSPAFSQYIVRMDLPSYRHTSVSNIHHIVQDKEGYMWYAMDGGLCRDNGYQIDVFRNDLEHPDFWESNQVQDLAVGRNDYIWVATDAGLYYLDKDTYTMNKVKDKRVPKTGINSISVMSDGSIWAIGGKNILKIKENGAVEKLYTAKNNGDGNKYVNKIYEDSNHDLWLFECRGVLRKYDKVTDDFIVCDWPENCEPYGGFVEDKTHGCFWISTWGKGIIKYTPTPHSTKGKIEFQPCTYEGNSLNSNKGKSISMCSSNDGHILWITAMDGFYAYNIKPDGSLESRNIDGILPPGKKILATTNRDLYGNIWVAAYSPRTFVLTPPNDDVIRYDIPSVLKESGIETIVESIIFDNDYAWIWHLRLNLMLHNLQSGDNNMLIQHNKGNIGSNVMCKRAEGGIWTCKNNTLMKVTHDNMSPKHEDVISIGDGIKSLYDDQHGHVWIGTDNSILRYDIHSHTVKKIFTDTKRISKIRCSKSGEYLYFISERKGLVKGNIKTHKQEILSKDITERISSVDVSQTGLVFFSTDLGCIYRYDEASKSIEIEKEANLQNSDMTLDICFDSFSHLWILTSQFIKEYNPENKASRYIYASDANINLDYFITISNAEGKMCVGGAGGYCLISPSFNTNTPIVPKITSLEIDGARHFITDSTCNFTIKPDDTNISIHFSTMDHLHAHNISYAYCLHETGTSASKWVYLPVGHNTAYFVGIQPGDYVLEVKATDPYGNWGYPVLCMNLESEPAWWATWWMRTLYIIIAITIFYLIAHAYYRNKMKNMEIQKLVNLAKELNKSNINNATNPNVEISDLPIKDEASDTEQDKTASSSNNTAEEKETPVILTKAEQKFIADAKAVVEKNLSNTAYTTEQFASDMCMSRMNLYRKLQKITGQKPSEFIRMIRLQAAAKMLKEGDYTVAEVSDRVGFSSPSYFTKSFKEAFGILPMKCK